MWSLVILFLCVAVVVAFAIYKISRENTQATSSAYDPRSAPVAPAMGESRDFSRHDLIGNMLQDSATFEGHTNRNSSHADQMVPMSTIVAGVEQFKASYSGPNRERIVAILDEGLTELKSRYGDQIPAHELREFIKAKRQQMFSQFS